MLWYSFNFWGSWNDNQRISWDSNTPLSSNNWNISVSWDNNSTIDGENWNISVNGNNKWNIENKNGNITILGNNESTIEAKNGTVTILKNNTWKIETKNGSIDVSWNNSSTIISQNWEIYVWWNNWEINLQNWKITIWKIKITIKKNNISVWWVVNGFNWNVNSIISIGSCNNVSIDDWWIFINWINLENIKDSNNNEYKIYIDDIEIDFDKKTAKKNWNEINITDKKDELIKLVWENIEIIYENQLITISKDYINVKWK